MHTKISKVSNIISRVIAGLLTAIFLFSASEKLYLNPELLKMKLS